MNQETVNHPPHYNNGGIECIDAIASALTPEELQGFIKGNVIKYSWRSNHKGGDEDLKKAQWYLAWYLEYSAINGGEAQCKMP